MKSSSQHQTPDSKTQVAVNLRKVLQKAYKCDGSLPAELSEQLVPPNYQSTSIYSDINEPENELEKQLIKQVLSDVNIPSNEREMIAKSILQGNFEIQRVAPRSNKPTHQQHIAHAKDNSTKQIKLLYENRHKLPKPHFLEVITESAKIPVVSPRKLYQEKVNLLKNSPSIGRLRPPSQRRQMRYNDEDPNSGASQFLDVGFHDSMESLEHRPLPGSPFITETTIDKPLPGSKATLYRDSNPSYRDQHNKLLAEDRL
jgi:hypothetical protein